MSLLYSSNFKYPEPEFKKYSQPSTDPNQYYMQQNQTNSASGLARYRSAPSAFFENLMSDINANSNDGGVNLDTLTYDQHLTPQIDQFYPKFSPISHDLQEFADKSVKQEDLDLSIIAQQQNGFSNGSKSESIYDSQGRVTSLQNQSPVEASFGLMSTMLSENPMQVKNGSNLIRQSSSPPGFFANLGVDNGFGVMGDGRSFRASDNHLNFSSGTSSSSRALPQISETGNETMGHISPENRGLSQFRHNSWDETSLRELNRAREDDLNLFSISGIQNGNSGHHSNGLTHHLSLTKNSTEMATVEKFLHFQNSIPCKLRAKRGFATHPRSIAERVRRTRISDRMRKLQDLFPDMDKQANTSDMLDMAVEYIKDLQKEVKTLTDSKESCKCSSKQKQCSNHSS
ncbi:hypothetical protein ACFE04_001809 [Oxalis oulophora]